jgi:transposase
VTPPRTAFTALQGHHRVVAIEVTGNAFEIYDSLLPYAGKVVVANPLEMRRLRSGRHTDKVDASRLAKMLALGTLPTVWVPPAPVRAVRRLLAGRERLMSMRTAAINQAKTILRRHWIEAGRLDPHDPEWDRVAEELWPDERVLFRATLRQLATVEETIAGIEAEILGRLKDDPGDQHLLTLPGVGPLTAATIWASIGDPSRFSSAREVARYAGLDPSVMQSGQIDRRGHISKNGSRRLRTALVEAAYSVVRHDLGSLGQFGRRLAAGKGPAKTACAVARKLLVVAWRLLLRGEDYRAASSQRIQAKRREVERRVERQPAWVEAARVLLPEKVKAAPPDLDTRRLRRKVS